MPQPAAVPVRHLAGKGHLVRDHQQRHSVLGQGVHHLQHLAYQLLVQRPECIACGRRHRHHARVHQHLVDGADVVARTRITIGLREKLWEALKL